MTGNEVYAESCRGWSRSVVVAHPHLLHGGATLVRPRLRRGERAAGEFVEVSVKGLVTARLERDVLGGVEDHARPTICEPDRVRDGGEGGPRGRSTTPFRELNDLLTEFVGSLQAILEAHVVGIYLTGSFALGGGDAASDCDFLVVTTNPLGGEHERALRQLHEEVPTWAGHWAYNLEGSYAPKADLQTLAALGRPWLYVNRGGRELEWSAHCNTEDVRWVLRNRPLILEGADPTEFACDVPTVALQRKMRTQIEAFLDDLLAWTTSESPGRSATRSKPPAACSTPLNAGR